MKIELDKPKRAEAIASLRQYADENLPASLGELAAGMLLDYFLEEIGPSVYNAAIADAQTRLHARVADLNGELFEDEFQYWPRQSKKRAKPR